MGNIKHVDVPRFCVHIVGIYCRLWVDTYNSGRQALDKFVGNMWHLWQVSSKLHQTEYRYCIMCMWLAWYWKPTVQCNLNFIQ